MELFLNKSKHSKITEGIMNTQLSMAGWYEQRVTIIGCGVMAQCLVDGWLKHNVFNPQNMILTDNYDHNITLLSEKYPSCKVTKDNTFYLFKPLMVQSVLSSIPIQHFHDKIILNGSALAFGCMAIEAMADGAVSMGLPRSLAISLSSHALLAASSLQINTGDHPAVLRDQITTPGGCTIARLSALEHGNFRSALIKAVQETTRVSKAMGNCKK